MRLHLRATPVVLAIGLGTFLQAQQAPPAASHADAGLTAADLLHPRPDSWPTFHGDYSGRHYSTLDQINVTNVDRLTLLWSTRPDLPTDEPNAGGEHEPGDPYYWYTPSGSRSGGGAGAAEPIVVDGTIYLSTPDHAYAIDAYTGRQLWHYYWKTSGGIHIGNRGMAMLGRNLFFVTPDCYLVSLDARTGRERWHSQVADVREQYFCTPAPVVIGNHVIQGMGGDSLDVQGYLSSFDPETGALQWRWYTTPQTPDDPGYDTWPDQYSRTHGGGMPWQPVTYDPGLNLLYVSTGNANPVFATKSRPGDNAYTASVAAINPDTGKMAWYFQFNKHESHDWDSEQVAVLFDDVFQGRERKLLGCACANGWFFLLDRVTGKNLLTRPYTEFNNTFLGVADDGTLIPNPKKDATASGVLVAPGKAASWVPPTYSPRTHLFYVGMAQGYNMLYLSDDSDRPEGWGAIGNGQGPYFNKGAIRAIDYQTGKIAWEFPWGGKVGLLSTAGGVIFTGASGYTLALDAKTGHVLWRTAAAGTPSTGPVTFTLDGRQVVLVISGGSLYLFGL